MEITVSIYCINCPISNMPIYVGKTENIDQRLTMHSNGNRQTKIGLYIKKLRQNGLRPTFHILEEFDYNSSRPVKEWMSIIRESEAMEVYWIHQFRAWGFNLLNRMHNTHAVRRNWNYFNF